MNTGLKLFIVSILIVSYLVFGSFLLTEAMYHLIIDILFIVILPLCALLSFTYMKGFVKAKKESIKLQELFDNTDLLKESCFFEMKKSKLGKTKDTQALIRTAVFAASILLPIGRIFRRIEMLFTWSETIWICGGTILITIILISYLDYITFQYFGYKGIEKMEWKNDF